MLVSHFPHPEVYADIDYLSTPEFDVEISVLRLDSFHTELSGNKYFKLKQNIQSAINQGIDHLVSFGGAFSNHIHALALAGRHYGLRTTAIIRGEASVPLNPTLLDASNAGMELVFVSREEYRSRDNPEYLSAIQRKYGPCLLIPEGGSNLPGMLGCSEIVQHIHHHIGTDYDYLCLACGTGATMAGLLAAIPEGKHVIGIPVLKGAELFESQLHTLLQQLEVDESQAWHIEADYHCGGYARVTPALVRFVESFESRHAIKLDHIYTGKCFMGLFDLLEKQKLPSGSRIVLIHTGGLQGERGMRSRLEKLSASMKGVHEFGAGLIYE